MSPHRHMPVRFIVRCVMNQVAGRRFDNAASLTNQCGESYCRPAHYGSVVLLTVGIYKKWPDTSHGCYVAAHAKLRRSGALNRVTSYLVLWGISALQTKVPRPSHSHSVAYWWEISKRCWAGTAAHQRFTSIPLDHVPRVRSVCIISKYYEIWWNIKYEVLQIHHHHQLMG